MLQNVEYPSPTSNINVKFWQHFWAENILKVPTKGKGIPDYDLTPCKLSILREKTYEICIQIVKRQKKKWNVDSQGLRF